MFKIRFWIVLIKALLRRQNAFDSRINFRCSIFDCDIYMHMNNAAYLKFMDLGRWDWIIRSGGWRYFLDARLQPVATNVSIEYRRSILPGQKFLLVSRFHSLEERTMKVSQEFWSGEVCLAHAVVTAKMLKGGKSISMEEMLSSLPKDFSKKFLPERLK